MPNVEVSCAVTNCIFHEIENVCGAEKIKVDMNYSKKDNAEFAADFDARMIMEKAGHSTDTCCKTFKPKKESLL